MRTHEVPKGELGDPQALKLHGLPAVKALMSSTLREIVADEIVRSRQAYMGVGTRKLTLSCGHLVWQKPTKHVPHRMHCKQCPAPNAGV